MLQKSYVIPKDGWPEWGVKQAWAPEIHYIDNNFIVYFSLAKSDKRRAIGYAKSLNSSNPFGPYKISEGPIIESDLGSIDPTWFRDPM